MLSRRAFIGATAASGALAATGFLRSRPAGAVSTWESPTSIDNTGAQNVSAALTEWLETTGQPGDIFKLRRGPGFAPGAYWIPQGIRVGKPMQLDLNGCWSFTGANDGSQFSPLWEDWEESATWPRKRVCINVASSDVAIFSSLVNARVQGGARQVLFRGGFPNLPTGCVYNSTLEGQAAVRIGRNSSPGVSVPTSNVTIDLANIALEFVYGDGVEFMDQVSQVEVMGRNLGEAVVGGGTVVIEGGVPSYLGAPWGEAADGTEGGLGGVINGNTWSPTIAVYPGIHHTSRHGISTTFRNSDIVIRDISIWRTGRAIVDLEPASSTAFNDRFRILNVESCYNQLLWLAAAGRRPINDLVVADCVSYQQLVVDTRRAGTTYRHSDWKLLRNRGGLVRKGSLDAFEVDRIDGLEIRDNFQVVRNPGQGINIGTSTDVIIDPAEDIQFPPV